ncbi:hypothetical protein B0H19DRAFT_1036390 [Mycena capillaripes]|nr:hypothetical protein B0H19DRAFT_1036390 [Mycena capillaripes]
MRVFSWAHLGVGAPFDPQYKFISSPVFSPAVLAGIRLLLALYALCTLCTVLGFDVAAGEGKSFLSFFTQLSYIGVTAYYWASAVQTLAYTRWRWYPLQRWPRALQALHVLLQSTITTFPFLVTVVFWALLSSPDTFSTTFSSWSNLSVHALNSVFALFDLLLTNTPPAPWLTLPFHILFLAGYLGVAYITHATQGFYTYPFLDPHSTHALLAAYIIGIAAGTILVFCVARGIAVLRQRAAVRYGRLPTDGDNNLIETREALEEWEEVERPVGGKREGGEGEGRGRAGRVIDSGVDAEEEV